MMKKYLLFLVLLLSFCFNYNAVEAKSIGSREDKDCAELDHNKFRYYDSNTGTYISKDPIGLAGGMALYNYVHDANTWIDPFGLTGTYMFTDGTDWYIGKGAKDRMYTSMKQRVKGKANVTQGIHVDFGDDKIGLMVEAELIRRNNAVKDPTFKNSINSPGEKLLKDTELNNKSLYDDIVKKSR
jgi:RHS repeat-associated protein